MIIQKENNLKCINILFQILLIFSSVNRSDAAVESIDFMPLDTAGIYLGELSLLQFILLMLGSLKIALLYAMGALPFEFDLGELFEKLFSDGDDDDDDDDEDDDYDYDYDDNEVDYDYNNEDNEGNQSVNRIGNYKKNRNMYKRKNKRRKSENKRKRKYSKRKNRSRRFVSIIIIIIIISNN